MLARLTGFTVCGIDAFAVAIEIDIRSGLPFVAIIGLPDTAVKESRDRVKAAIRNSGFEWPAERITISLSPSDMRKEGARLDLAIALGILAATGQLGLQRLQEYGVVGELALDGSVRPVPGLLSISLAQATRGKSGLIVPQANAAEAALNRSVAVFGVAHLREAVEFLHHPETIPPCQVDADALLKQNALHRVDFSEVKGQLLAKRAIEVAVAGCHNLLMIGPPGSGKTMLACRIPTIQPDPVLAEALEITKVHSVAGARPIPQGIMATRPFRAPHHTVSAAALVGGGSVPRPGEISLAHHGVLFLDELPEFRRDCLEALRQPLEEGAVSVARINRSVRFPASFMLVAAMNPCPCGYATDPQRPCRCSSETIRRYLAKVSGPLLDRIDIHINLPPVLYRELSDPRDAEPSALIKERVARARRIQAARLQNEEIFSNAALNIKLTKKYCVLEETAQGLLRKALTELGLSARAYGKILKVSRTIADLEAAERIGPQHIAEAINYRSLDRCV